MITEGITRTIKIKVVIENQIEINAPKAMIEGVTAIVDNNLTTRKTKVEITEVLLMDETDPTLVSMVRETT